MIADTFVDPFAHITWRENELFGVSGNQIDYVAVRGTTAVDFRGCILYIFWILVLKGAGRGKNFFLKMFH